jgi:hypothetical protein
LEKDRQNPSCLHCPNEHHAPVHPQCKQQYHQQGMLDTQPKLPLEIRVIGELMHSKRKTLAMHVWTVPDMTALPDHQNTMAVPKETHTAAKKLTSSQHIGAAT